ncbi:hypothetical protein J6590_077271, partial [Homalodisca vitripennis]
GSAARDPHGIKQITVGPPHGIKQITMFIRENVECLDSSFTTTTTIKHDKRRETEEATYTRNLLEVQPEENESRRCQCLSRMQATSIITHYTSTGQCGILISN